MLDKINADLKAALLAKDSEKATTLRMLKSVISYARIDKGEELNDEEIIKVLTKEAKKRQESADLFKKGGNDEKAAHELAEKEVIEAYLPEQMSDEEVAKLVDKAIESFDGNPPHMGAVIQFVMKEAKGQADGGTIARIAKEKMNA